MLSAHIELFWAWTAHLLDNRNAGVNRALLFCTGLVVLPLRVGLLSLFNSSFSHEGPFFYCYTLRLRLELRSYDSLDSNPRSNHSHESPPTGSRYRASLLSNSDRSGPSIKHGNGSARNRRGWTPGRAAEEKCSFTTTQCRTSGGRGASEGEVQREGTDHLHKMH